MSFSDEKAFKKEIKALVAFDSAIAKSLKENFIDPIENRICPFTEIVGRYKPSCEMDFINSTMKNAFIKLARDNNLYHYHFGYKFYADGNPDSKYQGMVSDGIIHTKLVVNEDEKTIEHRIIQVCTSHPTPFTVPYTRVSY